MQPYPRPLTRQGKTRGLRLLYYEPCHRIVTNFNYDCFIIFAQPPSRLHYTQMYQNITQVRVPYTSPYHSQAGRIQGTQTWIQLWTKTSRIRSCSGIELDTQLIWFIVWIWLNWIASVEVSSGNDMPWQYLLGNGILCARVVPRIPHQILPWHLGHGILLPLLK